MTSDVLVVFPHRASFIERDIKILERTFHVETLEYQSPRDRYRLLQSLRRTRVAVPWFVLGFAYPITRLSLVPRARSLLIPGGWDVDAIPELGYGEMMCPVRA